jgi:hypothetical protein
MVIGIRSPDCTELIGQQRRITTSTTAIREAYRDD